MAAAKNWLGVGPGREASQQQISGTGGYRHENVSSCPQKAAICITQPPLIKHCPALHKNPKLQLALIYKDQETPISDFSDQYHPTQW